MRIESGPAKAERNWQLARTVLFLGFAAYFVYDGAIGWPNQIRNAANLKLAAEPFAGKITYDQLPQEPSKEQADALLKQLPAPDVRKREDVERLLGKPTLSLASGRTTDDYYLTRWGMIKFAWEANRPTTASTPFVLWADKRDKGDLKLQFYMAVLATLPGLWFLRKLIRAVTLRVVVDDEGMTYAGQRIAFADMVSLRDYSPKGWIDLYYREGDRERKLRLDNEKVLQFDTIVDAVCQKKGFENEAKLYAERKERESKERAEDDAAVAAADQPADSDDVK